MAFPLVRFHTSAGSNALASGAGPEEAIVWSFAAHTNNAPSSELIIPNAAWGGISGSDFKLDGSELIYLPDQETIHFSRLLDYYSTGTHHVLVVEDEFTIPANGPQTVVLGGQRGAWDHAHNRELFARTDTAGWIFLTLTSQDLTAPLEVGGSGTTAQPVTFRGYTDNTLLYYSGANTSDGFFQPIDGATGWVFENFLFRSVEEMEVALRVHDVTLKNCSFIGSDFPLQGGVASLSQACHQVLYDCYFENCTPARHTHGGQLALHDCYGYQTDPVVVEDALELRVLGCIFNSPSQHAIHLKRSLAIILHSLFWECGDHALRLEESPAAVPPHVIQHNAFFPSESSGVLSVAADAGTYGRFIDYNAHRDLGGPYYQNLEPGEHDLLLEESPFLDPASGDFNLADNAASAQLLDVKRYLDTTLLF